MKKKRKRETLTLTLKREERAKREREKEITATVVGFVVHSQLADRSNSVERLRLEEKKATKTEKGWVCESEKMNECLRSRRVDSDSDSDTLSHRHTTQNYKIPSHSNATQ